MQLKATETETGYVVQILADNGKPANADNPITPTEYRTVEFPDINAGILIISGMPMSAVVRVALHYKNVFSAIAIYNPRNKDAEVVHSTTRQFNVGTVIDFELP